MIIDNFLDCYADLKKYAETAEFADTINPVDEAIYPHICTFIPESIRTEILHKIGLHIKTPERVTMFMRRSPANVHVPHIAHTDNSMGDYSLMLYLNEVEGSGTGFLYHKESGMAFAPQSEEFLAIVQRDQNNVDSWFAYDGCHSKENRACIFQSNKFHCALPVGGFGDGVEARTVLTVFFS